MILRLLVMLPESMAFRAVVELLADDLVGFADLPSLRQCSARAADIAGVGGAIGKQFDTSAKGRRMRKTSAEKFILCDSTL
jgi:hypothetical protein